MRKRDLVQDEIDRKNNLQFVRKSNELSRASWPAESVLEPRIVALVASRVRKNDVEFQEYEIQTTELLGYCASGDEYKQLKKACFRLMRTIWEVPKKDGKGWSAYTMFSKCSHDARRNVITARFDPDMIEHYLNLGERFTKYSLAEFLSLPTIYSQLIFEILKSWDDVGEKVITLDELFKMLSVPISMQRYPDFRRYVLEPTQEHIHKCTSLKYAWEPVKHGRAVAAIRFIFKNKVQSAVIEAKTKEKSSSAKNNALIAAVQCWKKCQGECTPKENLQCEVCARFVKS